MKSATNLLLTQAKMNQSYDFCSHSESYKEKKPECTYAANSQEMERHKRFVGIINFLNVFDVFLLDQYNCCNKAFSTSRSHCHSESN